MLCFPAQVGGIYPLKRDTLTLPGTHYHITFKCALQQYGYMYNDKVTCIYQISYCTIN